jgi:hypothetical protein
VRMHASRWRPDHSSTCGDLHRTLSPYCSRPGGRRQSGSGVIVVLAHDAIGSTHLPSTTLNGVSELLVGVRFRQTDMPERISEILPGLLNFDELV